MGRSHQIKFQRAQQHLDNLDALLSEWRNEVGRTVAGEPDPEDARFQIFSYRNEPIPNDRFAAVIGDAVQNLRASLDHLCCELAVAFRGQLTPKQRKSLRFPIHRLESESRDGSGALANLVGSDAAAIIQRLQPWASRPAKEEDCDLLWQLHELSLADQRESLALVNSVAGRWTIETIVPFDFERTGSWFRTGVPPKGSAPIARLPLLPEGTEDEVMRKIIASLDVALADPPSPPAADPIHVVLTDIADYIQSKVFKALEPLLPTSPAGR